MYKIEVKSTGKYNNAMLGARYALSKRVAKKTINLFISNDCVIQVTKLIKCGGCWVWSDDHDLYGGIWEHERKGE